MTVSGGWHWIRLNLSALGLHSMIASCPSRKNKTKNKQTKNREKKGKNRDIENFHTHFHNYNTEPV